MGDSNSTYHVVCRDCRTEEVVRSRRDAKLAAVDHRTVADHRVEFDRIDRQSREG